ncbi:MAG: polysaccharide polymerase [Okeania sp. SIO2C9]|uniref:polysaccharide pyruvyl transferase family protein n=1 Tax=Okeania sp. SIO2C9 TaxID=2607791 RepID=UPI0013C0FBAF|nr:polysaccharide pyruvyl transferase family protein [Okeania sp. SIO2C9]NEQ77070.1 polysaccharide polymerase [Okeania sp. SIO2C9]
MTNPETIKEKLHHSLANLEKYEKCALLDYPDYLNLGDHLIWLGSVLYLTKVNHTKIEYSASVKNFSAREMEEKIGQAPIFLNGGGNLGDLWGECQRFREKIITQYQDRPIVILPQSIYFKNLENLKNTANIFNSHPDLTIFVRDSLSYELASEYFTKCQIFMAPDMAFQMINSLNREQQKNHNNSILYLCRDDRELNQTFAPTQLGLSNLVIEDWVSYKWVLGVEKTKFMRLVATLFREGWQRGLATPQEWFTRQQWLASHPYTPKFQNLQYSNLHSRSWHFIHSAIYQLQPHKLVITNRLHGHILCILLNKPHIFLPNAYHKNELFYQTWTWEIPFCKFVKDLDEIPTSVSELLS